MPRDPSLIQAHVEALYTLDAAGDLVRVNDPDGAPAPRFFLGRTADGPACWFRHDVEEHTRRELVAAIRADSSLGGALDTPAHPAPYDAILARTQPVERMWSGPAFSFPEELDVSSDAIPVTEANASVLEAKLGAWLGDVPFCQPMMVLAVGGTRCPSAPALGARASLTRRVSIRIPLIAGTGAPRRSCPPGRGPCAKWDVFRSTARRGRTRRRGRSRGSSA